LEQEKKKLKIFSQEKNVKKNKKILQQILLMNPF